MFEGSPRQSKRWTPSTGSGSHLQEIKLNPQVSEFTTNEWSEMQTRQFEQKENDGHATDRFIPLRKTSSTPNDFGMTEMKEAQCRRGQSVVLDKLTIEQIYRECLLTKDGKQLQFGEQRLQKVQGLTQHLESQMKLKRKVNDERNRKIGKTPFKVLDAPNLHDDFYLNLLEWSSHNILSVALESSLYFWNGNNNKVMRFCQLTPDLVSSVGWNSTGSHIALGTSRGTVELWDTTKTCKVNQYYGHSQRVSSVAWTGNLLASGSRDRTINLRDIRQKMEVNKYQGHTQEVCGLKWSFDGSLLASGGNDNKLFVWTTQSKQPLSKFNQHSAAVKGIAWSPHNHGVLASGGGSADRTIKFWNTLDNSLIDSIDTGSQVCNLMFSKNTRELVSTHGYSNNEIIVWKYPTLQKMATLTGHSSRVLFLAMNPTGETIVTGAGDQTLRFWNIFPSKLRPVVNSTPLSTLQLR